MTLELWKWFSIEIQVGLRSSIIKFLGKISVVDISFALLIEIVDQILDLPVLKHIESVNILFQLRARQIPVFVFIKLVEDIFSLGIELYISQTIET